MIGFVAISLLHMAFALTTPTGVMVPLYIPPGIEWDSIVQVKLAHPLVPILAIINPQNGSGQVQDPRYVIGIQNLQSNGIVVLGYVDTNYTIKNNTEVKAEITNYKNWYNVNGIFFDQMSNMQGNENYYANLTTYTKSLGLTLTVGNSGVDTRPSYVGTVDNIVLYDNISLPTIQSLGGWHTNFTKNNFSILSYGINSLDQSFVNNASSYVGYMYMTNNTLPNPWGSIPDYFATLVTDLENDLPIATVPSPPSELTATGLSSQINLSWTTPSNNGGSAITGYKIYKSTSSGTETLFAAIGNVTLYNDTSVTNGLTYFYKATAVNSIGESLQSNEANATTVASTTHPSAPTVLKAIATSYSRIALFWTAPANNGGSPITGYEIERSNDGGATWSAIISNTGTNATKYANTGLAPSTTFDYRVSAINDMGTSAPSNTANATTLAKLTLVVKSVDLSGNPITGMWMELHSPSGALTNGGYTPKTFYVSYGITRVAFASDFGTIVFNHWDDGSTDPYRTITPITNSTLTAYFGAP